MSTAQVESVLVEHKDVAEAAVVPIPHASQTNSWDKSIKQIYKLGTVDRNTNKMPAQNLKRRKITPYRQKLCYNVGKQGSKVKTNQNKFNQLQPMMPVCPAGVKNIDHTKEKEEKKEIFNENKLN